MQVEVVLNKSDFEKYTPSAIKFWSKRRKKTFNKVDLILYGILLVILSFLFFERDVNLNWFELISGLLIGFTLLMIVLNEQKKTLEPKDMGFLLSPASYLISKEGITVKKSFGESFTSWDAIESVFNDKDYYYLFLDYNFAYIIPKRSFKTESELREFSEELNNHLPGKLISP